MAKGSGRRKTSRLARPSAARTVTRILRSELDGLRGLTMRLGQAELAMVAKTRREAPSEAEEDLARGAWPPRRCADVSPLTRWPPLSTAVEQCV